MRNILAILAALALAAPAFAHHVSGHPPGQIAKYNADNEDDPVVDRNGNGQPNGGDYSPGYSASVGVDRNDDGRVNGKDYAPGQHEINSADE